MSFDPSASTRSLSGSQMAPSAIDSLPNINFGFDELRERMMRFTGKFDTFIDGGRKNVLEERNQFHMRVGEIREDERMKNNDIEIVKHKITTLEETIAREDAETREMHEAIASLEGQRDRHLATRDMLKKQIEQTQREIDARLEAQRAHAAQMDAQARFNVPELDFWVSTLGLKIEGAGKDDRLKFIYSHIDEKDWEREAWFELSMSSRDYDVKHSRPKLDREKVEKVLDRVNESRELVVLLKGMRELFVEAYKN
ncbi:hypothetical protein TD95_003536 [Thielaviopsis punctulata]|uniref:Kinetochore protein SPC25 n=1 Tax=Thielaviopsis punctulata TaxID=72032 RepID=A0A0F4Z8A2_9PEZI|nr:hypothetical protein TD95_003536 [Thielaviopsis punctulata]